MKKSKLEILNETIKVIEEQKRVAKETQDLAHLLNVLKLLEQIIILRDRIK